eukprot:TRINITY_DN1589_c0_g1_i1.p1 TRINITY_DN1589_c0_g1~~TRINITY_DN1589_c0_g1_i1.p1  ORF type:complete len:536 (+),score=96.22 TRINITY_DN1589_c0_g1_i1:214-1821(+)
MMRNNFCLKVLIAGVFFSLVFCQKLTYDYEIEIGDMTGISMNTHQYDALVSVSDNHFIYAFKNGYQLMNAVDNSTQPTKMCNVTTSGLIFKPAISSLYKKIATMERFGSEFQIKVYNFSSSANCPLYKVIKYDKGPSVEYGKMSFGDDGFIYGYIREYKRAYFPTRYTDSSKVTLQYWFYIDSETGNNHLTDERHSDFFDVKKSIIFLNYNWTLHVLNCWKGDCLTSSDGQKYRYCEAGTYYDNDFWAVCQPAASNVNYELIHVPYEAKYFIRRDFHKTFYSFYNDITFGTSLHARGRKIYVSDPSANSYKGILHTIPTDLVNGNEDIIEYASAVVPDRFGQTFEFSDRFSIMMIVPKTADGTTLYRNPKMFFSWDYVPMPKVPIAPNNLLSTRQLIMIGIIVGGVAIVGGTIAFIAWKKANMDMQESMSNEIEMSQMTYNNDLNAVNTNNALHVPRNDFETNMNSNQSAINSSNSGINMESNLIGSQSGVYSYDNPSVGVNYPDAFDNSNVDSRYEVPSSSYPSTASYSYNPNL